MKTSSLVRVRVIGSVVFFLSLIGAYDYLMTFTHNTAYFEYLGYGDRQIEYFTNYPVPLFILITLGVWGTVIGSVLLLLKSRWAVLLFGIAFLGQSVLSMYTFGLRHRWEVLGPKLGIQDLLILMITLGILMYSIDLSRKKVID